MGVTARRTATGRRPPKAVLLHDHDVCAPEFFAPAGITADAWRQRALAFVLTMERLDRAVLLSVDTSVDPPELMLSSVPNHTSHIGRD